MNRIKHCFAGHVLGLLLVLVTVPVFGQSPSAVQTRLKRSEYAVAKKDSFEAGLASFRSIASSYHKKGWISKEIEAYLYFGKGLYNKRRSIGYRKAFDSSAVLLETAYTLSNEHLDSATEHIAEVYLRYGDIMRRKHEYDTATELFLKGLEFGRTYGKNPDVVIGTFFSMFHTYRNMKELNLAKAAIDSVEVYASTDDGRQQYAIHSLRAEYYTMTGQYEEAILSSEKKLAVAEGEFGKVSRQVSASYNKLYQLYDLIDERDQAAYYLKEGLAISLSADNYPEIGSALYALSSVAYQRKEYQKAANWISRMYRDFDKYEDYQKVMCLQRRPLVYQMLNKRDSAEWAAQSLLDLIRSTETTFQTMAHNKSAALRSLADYHLYYGAYDTAVVLCKEAIAELEAHSSRKTALSDRYNLLAKIYLKQRDYVNAKATIDQSASYFATGNPDKPFESSTYTSNVLDLYCHLYYYQYEDTKDTSYLLQAIDYSYQSFYSRYEIAGFFTTRAGQMRSKEHMRDAASDILEWSLIISENRPLNLKELSRLFEVMDRSKVYKLRLKLAGASQEESLWGVPDGFFDRLIQLKTVVSQLEQEYQSTKDSSKKETLGERLGQVRKELLATSIELKKEYPSFHDYLYNPPTISFQEVRQMLPEGSKALFFFQGLKRTYALSMSSDKAQLTVVDSNTHLNPLVQALNASIVEQNLDSYQEQAHELYKLLIVQNNAQDIEHLLVVPDENLYLIPWDALLTSQGPFGSYQEMPFAIKKHLHTVSHSANFLFQKQEVAQEFPVDVLSMGRNFENSDSFRYLSKAIDETAQIATSFSSATVFTNEEATEEHFLQYADQAGILHFATHTETDVENPMKSKLVLSPSDSSDGYLYLHELVKQKLHSNLAVLSACNSGKGQLQSGDGFINLGYGFAYAGCENAILTLWSSPDAVTAEIVTGTMEFISKGKDFNASLRQSKLDFLASADKATSAPFFWAGISYVGSSNGHVEADSPTSLWIGIGLGLLLLLVFIFWRLNRPKAA